MSSLQTSNGCCFLKDFRVMRSAKNTREGWRILGKMLWPWPWWTPRDVFEEAVVTWKAVVIHLAVISCVQFEEFSFWLRIGHADIFLPGILTRHVIQLPWVLFLLSFAGQKTAINPISSTRWAQSVWNVFGFMGKFCSRVQVGPWKSQVLSSEWILTSVAFLFLYGSWEQCN